MHRYHINILFTLFSLLSLCGDCQPVDGHICTTKACRDTASQILENLDNSTDPCSDFYTFVCGGFVNKTHLVEDEPGVNQRSLLSEKVRQKLLTSLSEAIQVREPRPFKLAKIFFQSCLNTKSMEENGVRSWRTILDSLGGWPAEDNSKSTTWYTLFGQLLHKGFTFQPILEVAIQHDILNSSKRLITIDKAKLGAPSHVLLRSFQDPEIQNYYDLMVKMARILGGSQEVAESEMLKVLEFEQALAQIMMKVQKTGQDGVLIDTIRNTGSVLPSIPWLELLSGMFHPYVDIPEEQFIAIQSIKYFESLPEVLTRFDNRTITNYMIWRTILESEVYFPEAMREMLQLHKARYNYVTHLKRPLQCVEEVMDKMPIAVGSLYVRNHFPDENRQEAKLMAANILKEFKTILQEATWMNDITKNEALRKSNAIMSFVGYPEELLNDTLLNDYHRTLQLWEGDFITFGKNISSFNTKENLRLIHEPLYRGDWTEHSDSGSVNALYRFRENSIDIRAGILQGVFFDPYRPKYLNYGAIGEVIGHEITHGFDTKGRKINADGEYVDWWDASVMEEFSRRADCFVQQYSAMEIPELQTHINGEKAIQEIIADNGGVRISYRAYERLIGEEGEEDLLPQLPFTPNQMFWISLASGACEKYRLDYLQRAVLALPHPPHKYRIQGMVSNSPDFARDFSCPSGSNMNPDVKCQLW